MMKHRKLNTSARANEAMIVECPSCATIFPVDPKKVPTAGIHARCSVCSEVFFVIVPPPVAADPGVGDVLTAEVLPEVEPEFEVEAEPEFEVDAEPEFEVEAEAEPELEIEAEPEFEIEPESEPGWGEVEVPAPDEYVSEPGLEEPSIEKEEEPVGVESYYEPVLEEPEVLTGWEAAVDAEAPVSMEEPEEAPAPEEEPTAAPPTRAPAFGKRDPMEKAQRLARVLVSDIILYNPDRHHSAVESGRVREEFEEEIQKSWTEYVEQVGEDVAANTTFFHDALNEILAKGEEVF